MHKSDKKLEKEIIQQLTAVCEEAKHHCKGFVWLTHEVNYDRFPESLKVTLVFNEDVAEATLIAEFRSLVPAVQDALKPAIGSVIPARQIEARREYSA